MSNERLPVAPSASVTTEPLPNSARERIIRVADAQFDAHNEYDAGVTAIGLASAREALLIAKERFGKPFLNKPEHDAIDRLLAELADGRG